MTNQNKFSAIEKAKTSRSRRVSFGLQRRAKDQLALTEESLSLSKILGFLILHAPLMIIFIAAPIIAVIHLVIVLFIGLSYLARDDLPTRVAWVIAYLAGAEILWRGVGATPVSEYGKFATLFFCILMILKYRTRARTIFWPLVYMAVLIPSIFVSPIFDRQAISFQLAGPVTIAVASMAFSGMDLKKRDLQRLFIAIIAPTIALAFLIIFTTATGDVAFSGGGANEEVTGGIGANQVTSALSLGATAAFFYIFLTGKETIIRNLMILLSIGLIAASILTFSRAGLWNAGGAIAVSMLFLIRSRWQNSNVFKIVFVLGLLGYFIVFPLLTNLTGEQLMVRFSDLDSTGRDILVKIDYQVFRENPFLGVGVGRSLNYHIPYFGYPKNTHTEYSRLLAEHGSLGVIAIVILTGVTFSRMFSRNSPLSKAISTSFTVWALLYLAHSATRMVAPSFAFGLAAARFLPEDEVIHE